MWNENGKRSGGLTACLLAVAALTAGLWMAGCGMPGAPQPPSLNLPQTVSDLKAVRTGDQVDLRWTMPRRSTDQLLLKDPIRVKICRTETAPPSCDLATTLYVLPSVGGSFRDALPTAQASGKPRALRYYLLLENERGRSAGPSNRVPVVAGTAPATLNGLTAEMHKNGVLLRWATLPGNETPVRLHRHLVTPTANKASSGRLSTEEPQEQSLLVSESALKGRALDKTTHFGNVYEYQAQRVTRVVVDGATVELAGALTAPVRIAARNTFPPDAPQGLVAVAATDEQGAQSIDLSWQPNTEADLAGYIVYRADASSDWQRISPPALVPGPAFRDAHVQPGHHYRYSVSAVDQADHSSPRSAETTESTPEN
ncbi:fibronectin type III domain-containing protein [Telmatobacter bradus]|uniref:fibronectin type III domain-containing protein n=1 Tax=Telmatobacter bradus TaxID=474953 RepID=UPI003B437F66